jgi:hypothetical protein
MVSLKTSPQPGFSRKRSIFPSSSTITIPNSRGFSACFRTTVAAAPRSRWNFTASPRSMSLTWSPEITRNVSSRKDSAFFTLPAVPSGSFSVA